MPRVDSPVHARNAGVPGSARMISPRPPGPSQGRGHRHGNGAAAIQQRSSVGTPQRYHQAARGAHKRQQAGARGGKTPPGGPQQRASVLTFKNQRPAVEGDIRPSGSWPNMLASIPAGPAGREDCGGQRQIAAPATRAPARLAETPLLRTGRPARCGPHRSVMPALPGRAKRVEGQPAAASSAIPKAPPRTTVRTHSSARRLACKEAELPQLVHSSP